MKIDNRSDLSVSTPGTAGAPGIDSGSRPAGGGSSGSGPDTAELSSLAGKISQAVSQDGADRAAKVDQLRAQVTAGTYQADSQATSHGIVNDALASAAAAGGSSRK
jgi:flagellar biosynthesis anti-sigma factor FlgM